MAGTTYSQITSMEATIFPWWTLLLEGLVAILLGLLFITRPVLTLAALVWLLGIYFLLTGIVSLISIFSDRSNLLWKTVYGILGVLAGLFIVANPLLGAILIPATIALYTGVVAIIMGAVMIVAAFKGGGVGTGVLGLLAIIFGLILVGSPFIAALTLLYLLAILAIAGGIILIFVAFKVRKATGA